MNHEQLAAAARTVIQLADYFDDLKAQALAIYDPASVTAIGYITPSQEQQVRQLQLSYWKARSALLELVSEIRADAEQLDRATPQQFLVALAAAALLVDAARFLRATFHHVSIVRRKLDEPDPVFGIPPRMYDDIQRSLVSVDHAWHLWQATRYYDARREALRQAAVAAGLERLTAIIDARRERLRPSPWTFLRTRLRVRGRRAIRRVGRDLVGRGVYAIQESLSSGLSCVSVRRGHQPGLPPGIRASLVKLLQPGDVLVVRKEYAATNYFLPGYWPHAALFVGSCNDLDRLGIADHEHVRPRWQLLAAPTADNGLPPSGVASVGSVAETPAGPCACVLEAMKDGVRVRPVDSALASDSVVLIRPRLPPEAIARAIGQAMMHEGKPYDFDFDFCVSHRLVCTEVVYRAYEGVAGVRFELKRHLGRFALPAGDLLRMALAERHFSLVAVYSPAHARELATGPAAAAIVGGVEGGAGG